MARSVKQVPVKSLNSWDRIQIDGFGRQTFTIISIREDEANKMRFFRIAGYNEGALPSPVGIAYGSMVRKVNS